ncbi:hypothetical protein N7509_004831 [Penicillium cosmopolitanum]|uniref:Uncharacterized protein n=1 Tax=Penicillium cosmopolitanum TaxID=1131564 RepID=A0A9W9W1A6_9EURO|nr:uncharacterized protein N7509_004831 [Penicillium cosmopolitanum]KAJ5396718.1 hypothetical protein N7509_004831 [Penicillium cosmopolitanum]
MSANHINRAAVFCFSGVKGRIFIVLFGNSSTLRQWGSKSNPVSRVIIASSWTENGPNPTITANFSCHASPARTIASYTGSPLAAKWPGIRSTFRSSGIANEKRATTLKAMVYIPGRSRKPSD